MAALTLDVTLEKGSMEKLKRFAVLLPNAVDQVLRKTAADGLKLIVKDTPVKTGAARRSWRTVKLGHGTYSIVSDRGAGAEYVPYLEYGTGIYGPKKKYIRPKTAPYLHFPIIKGNSITGWVRALKVAGMPARKMVANNIDKIKTALNENFRKFMTDFWR